MKFYINKNRLFTSGLFLIFFILSGTSIIAQGEEKTGPAVKKEVKKPKAAKIFESVWIGDNQTVTVPVKKTFEMDISHRFGTVKKGYQDFWGFFAPSNIRLGFSY